MLDGSLSPPEFDLPGSHQQSTSDSSSFINPDPKTVPSAIADINVNLALRCPICQDPYYQPKQLNCGHSFCLSCLEGTQHLYSINCPICRKATCFNIPGLNGLRLLPNNYALSQIVEAVVLRQENEEMDLSENELKENNNYIKCNNCNGNIISDRVWYCADCGDGGQKFCSNCMVEKHRNSHRCIRISEISQRWRGISCKLDSLKTKLCPVRTTIRRIGRDMKEINLKYIVELEKRSEFLCNENKIIEELLEKADTTKSTHMNCENLMDLEDLFKKLEFYTNSYGIGLNSLKENVNEASNSLNKIIQDVNRLEKNSMENENKLINENVIFAWKSHGAKSVSLAGSFSDWKPNIKLVQYKDEFVITIQLRKGRHEFKFLVDGEWKHNEEYDMCEDGWGGLNNLIIL